MPRHPDRRRFLSLLAAAIAALPMRSRVWALPRTAGDHPDPRPGIDASKVLTADQVPPALVELYDAVRAIPQIVDGIRCHCGCAELEGFYSLLTCYEESRMPFHCEVCQGEGRMATRLHGEGRTLDEIRAAIDRRFA